MLAQEETWAHATGAPEVGGLLLATSAAPGMLGDEYWQVRADFGRLLVGEGNLWGLLVGGDGLMDLLAGEGGLMGVIGR